SGRREHNAARVLQYGGTLHTPPAHVITLDGPDDAHGWATGHAEMGLQGEGWLAAFRYVDEYRRVDGAWRFARRELNTYYYLRMADLAEGLGGTMRRHYRGELRTADLPEELETYKRLHGLG
ncbi:MAG: nuclear transport factor 2 family protein, partial [Chloroflexota bacterium]|nr:nuclear transport factor 2 family protein [Chloroflexota bacterium]